MAKIALGLRYLMGVMFFVFGLNGFFHFIPQPPMPEKATTLIMAFINSGYLFSFIKTVEVLVGLSLLSGFYVRLSLIVIAPITVNIFLFHAFLAPEDLPVPIILMASNIFIAYVNKNDYASLFKMKG